MQFAIHQCLSEQEKPTKHLRDTGCRVADEGNNYVLLASSRQATAKYKLDAKGAYHGDATTNQRH